MPLQKQTKDIQLFSGLDTEASTKLTQGLLTLQNGQFNTTGQLIKRYGLSAIAQSGFGAGLTQWTFCQPAQVYGMTADSKRMYMHADVKFQQPTLFRYETGQDYLKAMFFDLLPVDYTIEGHTPTSESISDVAITPSGNYLVFTWLENNSAGNASLRYMFVDNATGAAYTAPREVATVSAAVVQYKVVGFDTGAIMVAYKESGGTTLYVKRIQNLVGLVSVQAGTNLTGLASDFIFDVCEHYWQDGANAQQQDAAILFVVENAAQTAYYQKWFSTSATSTTQSSSNSIDYSSYSRTPGEALCVYSGSTDDGSGNRLFTVGYADTAANDMYCDVWYLNSSGIAVNHLTPTRFSTAGGGTVTNITVAEETNSITGASEGSNETCLRFFWEILSATGKYAYSVESNVIQYDGSDNTDTDRTTWYHCGLASKAFTHGDHKSSVASTTACVILAHESSLQSAYYLVTVAGLPFNTGGDETQRHFTPHAKILQDTGGGISTANCLQAPYNYATGKWYAGLVNQNRLLADGVVIKSGIKVDLNLAVNNPGQVVSDGTTTVMTGGFTKLLDQVGTIYGGMNYIENSTIAMAGSGGSLSAGVYQYKFVVEWTDSSGNIYRSQPSPAFSETAVSNDQATLTYYNSSMRTLMETEHTLSGLSGVIPSLPVEVHVYRTEADGSVFYKIGSYDFVNLADDTVTVVDGVADSTITDNELLYTNGGVVGNDFPPASSAGTISGNRMWLVPMYDRKSLWFSKPKTAGLAYEFSSAFTARIQSGGDIVAIKDLDGKLIIFKSDEIHYLYGDGPNALGAGQFSNPVLITNELGCLDRDSVVRVPEGLLFRSRQGIYLLDRSLQVQWVGRPVEAYRDDTVLSAIVHPLLHQARFVLDSNVTLVYDYMENMWSVFTYDTDTQGIQRRLATLGSILYSAHDDGGTDIYYFKEDSSVYDSTCILTIETPWLKLAGISGYKRIYRVILLGDYKSAHTLNVEVYYDYVDTVSQTVTKAFAADPTPYQLVFRPAKPKCTAIKLKIYDSALGGTNEGYAIDVLSLQAGVKRGQGKYGSGRTM